MTRRRSCSPRSCGDLGSQAVSRRWWLWCVLVPKVGWTLYAGYAADKVVKPDVVWCIVASRHMWNLWRLRRKSRTATTKVASRGQLSAPLSQSKVCTLSTYSTWIEVRSKVGRYLPVITQNVAAARSPGTRAGRGGIQAHPPSAVIRWAGNRLSPVCQDETTSLLQALRRLSGTLLHHTTNICPGSINR